jgi:selenocysteine-specific elongation factor
VRVFATAGHVDHGKSALVRALTGMEPDRFAEERRRGLTIDLGYAWVTLPSGEHLAFVDVPGHERFIGNMLAGIGPAPAVLFVVAADEGWSRQSEEHLAAVDGLAVRHGLLAVTKCDLADPATALAQSRARIARSSLGEMAAVAVSAVTGSGVDDLRAALDRVAAALPAPDHSAPVRLWLDRSFTMRGSGTVVTGTLSAGSVAVGDVLETQDGRTVVVRGVQSAGRALTRIGAVSRVALNLRGIARTDLRRGDVLLTPDAWHRTWVVDVRLHPPGRLPAALVLHVGTAAVPVRIRPLGEDDEGLARLTAGRALPLRAGDRAILRDPGRHTVAAGVLVLDADPPPLARRGAAAARAHELARATGVADLAAEVTRRGAVRRAHLARLGVPLGDAAQFRGAGDWLVSAAQWQRWQQHLAEEVAAWAVRNPLDPAAPVAALRRRLQIPDDAVVTSLAQAAGLQIRDGRITRADAVSSALDQLEPALRELAARLAGQPFAAPERADLVALGLGRRELAAAERAGRLLRLAEDIVVLPDAVDLAAAELKNLPQPFTTSEARQALGTTRRVVIPLLEYLDRVGRTERVDPNHRRVNG